MTVSSASPSVPIQIDVGPEPMQPDTGPQPGRFPLRRFGCCRLIWEIICVNSSNETASIATLFVLVVAFSALKAVFKAAIVGVKSVRLVSY